ncbi:GNAT family N-acetyltransferase [Actinomadura rubrisoli]|uniref:GNAT family N-acetyltransferase n=1 Tax=Actinomadura rubrisoli TaxID=2530368 RepID=A0A4R5C5E8_9ACTN|nr:GNAT family N-acetyltransferase [Actinomadura rubrisoli]TDD93869.1 GNAT family N-acetyltransferase [Actinomadura rubrisoli]
MILSDGVGTAPAPAASTGEWTVEAHRDGDALHRLADELRDLYDRSPAATPFQTYEWLSAWWDSYGTPGRLRLVLVRCQGRLVAAAPLMAGVRWGFPVLIPLATGQSDFIDFLLDPVYLDGAVQRLGRALLDEPGWCALDLDEVRPGSAAHLVAQSWPGRTWRMPASVCLELPAADIGEVLGRVPGRTAGKMRAKLRRIDACGVTAEQVPPERAAEAVHALLDLHLQQWRDRPVNPEHTRERFRRHLAGAASAMARDGRAAVIEYRRHGRLVAGDLVLIGHRFVGAYLYGSVPGLRADVDVSLMMLRQDLAVARERGRAAVSLLRGTEPYKLKWRPDAVQNQRIVLGRSAPAALFAGLALTRARLAARRHRRAAARAFDSAARPDHPPAPDAGQRGHG